MKTERQYTMSKILVTGGAGFIGSHVVDALIKDNHEVWIVDNLSRGSVNNLNSQAKFIKADIENFDFDSLPKIDIIFHLAALARIQPSIIDPLPSTLVNVFGSVRVFDYARRVGAKVVFSGSSSVYGLKETEIDAIAETKPTTPQSPYALDKLTCEAYLDLFSRLYGLKYVILRYFNVYGERQILEGAYATVIGIFLSQLKNNQPFTIVGDGNQRRDFTHVSDVVRANLLAAFGGVEGGVFNIGTGTSWSINQVAGLINKDHPVEFIPERPGEAREVLANNSKALQLGWKPTIKLNEWINTI